MNSKKRWILFAIQFPMTLLIGVLLYFAYSMQVHDQPNIDWVVAFVLAILLDVVITLINRRDEQHQHKIS